MVKICQHACSAVQYDEDSLKNLEQLRNCYDCKANRRANRWLCLAKDCGYVGCSEKQKDHSSIHFKVW